MYIYIYLQWLVSIMLFERSPNYGQMSAVTLRTDGLLRCFEFNNCIVRLFFNLNKKIHEKARASIFIVWYSMHCCGNYPTDIFWVFTRKQNGWYPKLKLLVVIFSFKLELTIYDTPQNDFNFTLFALAALKLQYWLKTLETLLRYRLRQKFHTQVVW